MKKLKTRKKSKTHKLFYIGNEYYHKSNSMIGVLYTEKWERSDWGRIQMLLEAGDKVTLRRATKAEMKAVERFYQTCCLSQALEDCKW